MNQVLSPLKYGRSSPLKVREDFTSRNMNVEDGRDDVTSFIGKSRLEMIRIQFQKRLDEDKHQKLESILEQQRQQKLKMDVACLKPLNVYKDIHTVRAFFAQKKAKQEANTGRYRKGDMFMPSYNNQEVPNMPKDYRDQPISSERIMQQEREKQFQEIEIARGQVNNQVKRSVRDQHRIGQDNSNLRPQRLSKEAVNSTYHHPLPPIGAKKPRYDTSRNRRYHRSGSIVTTSGSNSRLSNAEELHSNVEFDSNVDKNTINEDKPMLGHIKSIRHKKLKEQIIRRLSSKQIIQGDSENDSIIHHNTNGDDMSIDRSRTSSNLSLLTKHELNLLPQQLEEERTDMDDVRSKSNYSALTTPHNDSSQRKSRKYHKHKQEIFDNAVKTVNKSGETSSNHVQMGEELNSSSEYIRSNDWDINSHEHSIVQPVDHDKSEKRSLNMANNERDEDNKQPSELSNHKGTKDIPNAFVHVLENVDNTNIQDNNIELVSCPTCGRKFAEDRISKHQKICKKATGKKRKIFDPSKHRTRGTDMEQYISTMKDQPTAKPKKSNWRAQHENFLQAIKAAKVMEAHVAKGGKLSDLPPPPPTENPDYVKCPYCQRKFNEAAAKRHIPKCKDIKSRPPPPKRR